MTPRIPVCTPLIIVNFIFLCKLCSIGLTLSFVWVVELLFCFKGDELFFEIKYFRMSFLL